MIVVQSSTSASPRRKAQHALLELALGHLAVRDEDPHLGHDARAAARAIASIVCTRLCTKKTCPPRRSSRRIASRISDVVEAAHLGADREAVGAAACGSPRGRAGPLNAIWSVRGIGVAVSVSTSTRLLQLLDALLVRDAEAVLLVDDEQAEVAGTRRPSGAAGACRSRCRRRPSASPSSTRFAASPRERKRESDSTRTG